MTPPRQRGIVCSAAEVRGLLDGRVSLLVRPVVGAAGLASKDPHWPGMKHGGDFVRPQHCPLAQPGERLFVRETWAISAPVTTHSNVRIAYRADVYEGLKMWVSVRRPPMAPVISGEAIDKRWRSATQMPAWASRVSIEVVSVRIARLQELSEHDADAMGGLAGYHSVGAIDLGGGRIQQTRRLATFWDMQHGKRYPWKSNPWCWMLGVKRAEVRT